MMMGLSRLKYSAVVLFVLSCLTVSYGQSYVGISIDKDTIEPGDIVNLKLNIQSATPLGEVKIDYSPMDTLDNVAMINDTTRLNAGKVDIEWIDAPFGSPTENIYENIKRDSVGKYSLRQNMKFTVWDIGAFRMPTPYIISRSGDTVNLRPMMTKPLFVLIDTNVVQRDTTKVIFDNHDIIREKRNWKDYLWLIILVTMLVAGLLIYWAVSKRKKTELELDSNIAPEPEPYVPAHIRAFDRLRKLRQEKPWTKGQVKSYQTDLTFAIREYLENRFDIQALESTTGEILDDLKEKDFEDKHSSDLTQILQIADMVKFAKATPSDAMHESFLDKAEAFVRDTKLEEEVADE